jgi:uncharacterized protein YjiS (DUF1127 family)
MTSGSSQAFLARRRMTPRHTPRGAVEQTLAVLHKWRPRSRDRAGLAALDKRMLEDIGLTRAEAEAQSRKQCWRG